MLPGRDHPSGGARPGWCARIERDDRRRSGGDLDLPALRAAVGDVVARHEVLRTVYPEHDSGPVQVILPVAQAIPE
ncbi:hypothetical protein, partial [Nocardia wallacei]|uniref:hypothetical protein n=1 Tax=Nocardia wallacei TaxID=480035 RepID=UPI0024544380